MTSDSSKNIIEKRLQLLELVNKTGNISKACKELGIDRKRYYVLKKRYEQHGIDGLKDKSRAHHNHPNKLPEQIEKRIIRYSQNHPSHGSSIIKQNLDRILTQDELEYNISKTTIQNCLNRNGLNTKQSRQLKHGTGKQKVLSEQKEKLQREIQQIIHLLTLSFLNPSKFKNDSIVAKPKLYSNFKKTIINYYKQANRPFKKNYQGFTLDDCIIDLPLFIKSDMNEILSFHFRDIILKDWKGVINTSHYYENWELLNIIIDVPDLYEIIAKTNNKIDKLDYETDWFLLKTRNYRNKQFKDLSYCQKYYIRKLNRKLLEIIYAKYFY